MSDAVAVSVVAVSAADVSANSVRFFLWVLFSVEKSHPGNPTCLKKNVF